MNTLVDRRAASLDDELADPTRPPHCASVAAASALICLSGSRKVLTSGCTGALVPIIASARTAANRPAVASNGLNERKNDRRTQSGNFGAAHKNGFLTIGSRCSSVWTSQATPLVPMARNASVALLRALESGLFMSRVQAVTVRPR